MFDRATITLGIGPHSSSSNDLLGELLSADDWVVQKCWFDAVAAVVESLSLTCGELESSHTVVLGSSTTSSPSCPWPVVFLLPVISIPCLTFLSCPQIQLGLWGLPWVRSVESGDAPSQSRIKVHLCYKSLCLMTTVISVNICENV